MSIVSDSFILENGVMRTPKRLLSLISYKINEITANTEFRINIAENYLNSKNYKILTMIKKSKFSDRSSWPGMDSSR